MSNSTPLRVAFLGSGAFGLPTLRAMRERFEIPLVVSQPDRPAGRGRETTPTPISAEVKNLGADAPRLLKVEDVNAPEVFHAFEEAAPDALLVIAFGQKLGPELLKWFAINLHASLLPRWRGAAPINRAIMAGDSTTGVSVISLASRMDAGDLHAQRSMAIEPEETAGELHDRLAELGVEPVKEVLERYESGSVECTGQEECNAINAPKLSKREATVRFNQPADLVRARVHGLNPWPGCDVLVGGEMLRLRRLKSEAAPASKSKDAEPGTMIEAGLVACSEGAVRLLEVQTPGKAPMLWEAHQRGHRLEPGVVCEPIPERTT
jgi:methionyl-tRNA formyltransferase